MFSGDCYLGNPYHTYPFRNWLRLLLQYCLIQLLIREFSMDADNSIYPVCRRHEFVFVSFPDIIATITWSLHPEKIVRTGEIIEIRRPPFESYHAFDFSIRYRDGIAFYARDNSNSPELRACYDDRKQPEFEI